MWLNIIFWIFVAFIAVQLIYYIIIFGKTAFVQPKKNNLKRIPISVIVCAKNESENVKRLIPELLNQNYPDYEIVLIDDDSSDDTLDIFEDFEKQSTKIRLVKVKNTEAFWGNKKYALTLGIKAATKEYLLFTDADCIPANDNWIATMSANFTLSKTIILGYGAYNKIPNSLLNKIIRLETLLTAVQYFSWAKIGKPYMGVGRNMAYKKEEFFNVRGFIDHMKVRSGDDDLFINQASNSKNTVVCYHPDSFTYSDPKTTVKDWIVQKQRHVTTAKYYKPFDQFQLGLFFMSQLACIILPILLLSFQFQWIAVLSIWVFRYIFVWITLGFAASKLKEKDLMYFFPFVELLLIVSQIVVYLKNLYSKPTHWK